MIVEARHPAVVAHQPAPNRPERISLVALWTTVRVPEASRGDFAPVDIVEDRADGGLHLSAEGGVWRRLGWHPSRDAFVGASASDLRAWLEDAPDKPLGLEQSFRGTPLGTWGRGGLNDVVNHLSPALRGGTAIPIDPLSVRRDGRAAAPAAVVRFVSERLRVVGDETWIRVTPALVLSDAYGSSPRGEAWIGECDARPSGHRNLLASPLSMDAALSHRGYDRPEDPATSRRIEAWAGLGIGEEIEDRRLRSVLEAAVATARHEIDATISRKRPGAPEVPGLRALRAEAWDLELDALTGLGSDCDPVRTAETILRVLDAAAGTKRAALRFTIETNTLIRDLRRHYLPAARVAAARGASVPDEDLAGLSAAAGLGR